MLKPIFFPLIHLVSVVSRSSKTEFSTLDCLLEYHTIGWCFLIHHVDTKEASPTPSIGAIASVISIHVHADHYFFTTDQRTLESTTILSRGLKKGHGKRSDRRTRFKLK